MFLKRLYQQNKFLFTVVIAFLSTYVFLNLKWGMIATPVQQYGMFSGKHDISDSLPVYFVKANGNLVNNAELSVIQRDFVQAYPEYYQSQYSQNAGVYNSLKKYLFFAADEQKHNYKFFNKTNDDIFSNWFRKRMSEIMNQRVNSLELYKRYFYWNGEQMLPLGTPEKMKFIAER